MSSFFKRWSTLKTENTVAKVEPVATPELPPVGALSPDYSHQDAIPADTKADIQADTQADISQATDLSGNTPEGATDSPLKTLPTLEDVAKLTKDSDFSEFMNKDLSGDVHQAAMKKLFSDPHFNVMDRLDIYIDDYSLEDPLPAGMLEKMYQSSALGIFKSIDQLTDPASELASPIPHQPEPEPQTTAALAQVHQAEIEQQEVISTEVAATLLPIEAVAKLATPKPDSLVDNDSLVVDLSPPHFLPKA